MAQLVTEFRTQTKGLITFTAAVCNPVISTRMCAIGRFCNGEKVPHTSFTCGQDGHTHFTNFTFFWFEILPKCDHTLMLQKLTQRK